MKLRLQGVNGADNLWSEEYDDVILISILPQSAGYEITFFDLKDKKEKTENVTRNAEFYFDKEQIWIEDDTY